MMPRDPRAYLQRAEEHRRHGRLKEAIALSIEALGRHPNLDAVRVTLGRAYLENAQPEEARTTLHEVFARQPSHHLAGKFLVESQRLLGDLAGAAATCRTLLEHYPRDREIEPLLAEIVRAQSSPETADAPPPPALKAAPAPALKVVPAAPPSPEDEADPQPDYLPEDLGSPRSPAPVTGASSDAPAKAPAPISAAPAPVPPSPSAPANPPGLSTAQIDRAIEAARPPSPMVASAPKASPPPPTPPVPPIAAKPVVSEPLAPPRPIAAAPMAPTPRIETVAPAPAGPAAAPAPTGGATSVAGASATKPDALETNTLAELYVKQGLPDRAIDVYRSMLRVEPGNVAARHRLAELEAAGAAAPVLAARPASTKSAMPVSPKAATPASSSLPTPPKSDATLVPKPAPPPVAAAKETVISEPPRAATAVSPAATVAATSRPSHPNRAAIDRLERWLDTVKRGQKGLDGGAAA